jgi:hypothetical protein
VNVAVSVVVSVVVSVASLGLMADVEGDEREGGDPEEHATWENVVVGKVKRVAGRVFHDEELEEEGEEQEEIAHELREGEDGPA